MPKGSARYVYERLGEKDVIATLTLTMDNIGIKYNALVMIEVLEENKFRDSRKAFLEYIMEENPNHIINKFSLVGDIYAPTGTLLMAPIFQDGQLELLERDLRGIIEGTRMYSISITNVLTGRLLYRRSDNLYSGIYETLVSLYKKPS